MYILGISAFYHDSAAALVCKGHIVAAAQEERFTRIKHDPSFPSNAIRYCLEEGNIRLSDVTHVVFYEKPFLKFERLIETYLNWIPKGFQSFRMAMPIWIKDKLFQKQTLLRHLREFDLDFQLEKLLFSEHHLSHAASAFYPSPFNEALIITMDGVGEWASTSLALGKENKIEILKEIHFPHSLGLLYSAFTYYCGFKVNSGEYKLMGLAPYGKPIYIEKIKSNLIEIKDDGSFRLNQIYFNYCVGLTMTNSKFDKLFGRPVRKEGEDLTQFHMDLAASIQVVTEEVIIKIARWAFKDVGVKNLCLAGGVALNCVANGKLLKEKIFENFWIQPAAGDAGGALGAALAVHYMLGEQARILDKNDSMQGGYIGPSFSESEIFEELEESGARYERMHYREMINWTAEHLSRDKVIGWFQGRMEFGPRALGNRSILGNPESELMQKTLNLKIKYRESFRPFAPAVLAEDVEDWFDLVNSSPYMLIVSRVAKKHCVPLSEAQRMIHGIDKLNLVRSKIPAVTHVDYSARIQTVNEETNPEFFDLISEFRRITGCPMLINTSFNIRGEPIVCSPSDAFNCFMGTDMDALIIGNFVLRKEDQEVDMRRDYKDRFKLD